MQRSLCWVSESCIKVLEQSSSRQHPVWSIVVQFVYGLKMTDAWEKVGATNLSLSRTGGWRVQCRQHTGCGCHTSMEAAMATVTVSQNPGLKWVHRSSTAQPCFQAEQDASLANRPGFILRKGTPLYSLCVITEHFNIWVSVLRTPQPACIPRVTKNSSKITSTLVCM